MRFSHNAERAAPGYYSVRLASPSILVELTTTVRAGFHRYTFPGKESPRVVINPISGQEDSPTDTYLRIDNDSLVTGYRYSHGWAAKQEVFFAARFSKPITHAMLVDTGSAPREIRQIRCRNGCRAILDFASADTAVLGTFYTALHHTKLAFGRESGFLPIWPLTANATTAWLAITRLQ
jgi:putative alpha-1,2-mannosidase